MTQSVFAKQFYLNGRMEPCGSTTAILRIDFVCQQKPFYIILSVQMSSICQ